MTGPRSSAPVPATTLDVEACVRLLNEVILWISPHDEQSIADADQLRALASALPGMGNDSERYRFLRDNPLQLRAIDGNANAYRTNPTAFDELVDAARAAQPEETSADAQNVHR